MAYNKYTIYEVQIGDEVYFDSTDLQHNQNEYWIVKDVFPEKNEIYISTPPGVVHAESITIDIAEIRARLPKRKNKQAV